MPSLLLELLERFDGRASVSFLASPRAALSRVSLSIRVQRQNSPLCALSG
jgi:hypothetical protein